MLFGRQSGEGNLFCQITSHYRHKKLMAHTGVSRADTVTTGWINPMIRQRRVDRKSNVTSMAAANRSGALCSGSAAV